MPRKAAAAAAPVFDLAQFREPAHYVTRVIEWGDEGQAPLTVTVQDLSVRQTRALTWEATTPMDDIRAMVAPYVVGWDYRAENIETGEMVDVPPPADLGPEVLELLPDHLVFTLLRWLATPGVMQIISQKKASTPSASTTDSPSDSD